MNVERPTWLNLTSPGATWAGLAIAAIGFVLIGVAWSQIAGEELVFRQLPYLVSAGMTGLGFIMIGMTLINVSAKRRDAVERERQIGQLVSILEEVKTVLADQPVATPRRSRTARK